MGKLRILVVEPELSPYVKIIDDTLEAQQKIVSDYVEYVYPDRKDSVALVCAESAKIYGMPFNRALRENEEIRDTIHGTFFIIGLEDDCVRGLTNDEITKYENIFHSPEVMMFFGNSPIIMKTDDYLKDTSGELMHEFYKEEELEAQLAAEMNLVEESKNTVKIYQLREELPDARDYRYVNYKNLKSSNREVEGKNYHLVYEGNLKESSLESIYQKFQWDSPDVPSDFKGHSLSVSDVIVIENENGTTANFVDRIGFVEIPKFFDSLQPEIINTFSVSGISIDNEISDDVDKDDI